jgi:hypothetical protein
LKKLLPIFGALDIITLFRSYKHFIPGVFTWANFPLVAIGNIVLYVMLFFSAIFLLRQNKLGLWLTYVQFPLRLAFLVLSFGFLFALSRVVSNSYMIILGILIVLEIVRLLFTINIHRKYFFKAGIAV